VTAAVIKFPAACPRRVREDGPETACLRQHLAAAYLAIDASTRSFDRLMAVTMLSIGLNCALLIGVVLLGSAR
jgi:hypothetical protein